MVLWLHSAAHHPAVVWEGSEVLAHAAAGVEVAAEEVEDEEEEEDGDYGVADRDAGLRYVLAGSRYLEGVDFGLPDSTTSFRSHRSSRSCHCRRRRTIGGRKEWKAL